MFKAKPKLVVLVYRRHLALVAGLFFSLMRSWWSWLPVSPLCFLRFELVFILDLHWLGFLKSSLETILTPITAKFFDWNTTQNSLCYVGIGLTVLVGYFVLMIAQKKCNLEDRLALLIGSAGIFVCMISVLFTWPIGFNKSGTGTPWLFPVFCIEIGFGVFFLERFWLVDLNCTCFSLIDDKWTCKSRFYSFLRPRYYPKLPHQINSLFFKRHEWLFKRYNSKT